jgi:polyhydroxyalkanoate synthase subunit PhaC
MAPASKPHWGSGDPQAYGKAMGDMLQAAAGLTLPASAIGSLQAEYMKEAAGLWNGAVERLSGKSDSEPAKFGDRRFAAGDWAANPATALAAQTYLLNSRTLLKMADAIEGDAKTKARVRFAVQQWIDAASPSNYLALNPEAQRKALETKGESIAQGLAHLWGDVQQGHVSQTDETVFEVGRNVATSEGAVVFENELFQLLEYKPLTAKVHERPMLFVPPCINKYYILDLQPDNSLIRYTVSQGHRTFVVSWRNPDESVADKTWDDYIEDGAIRAIREVQAIGGQKQFDMLGFCVGGTILSTALAVLAARNEHPAASLTLLTTLLDFSNTGVLDLFIDEPAVQLREATIGEEAPNGPGLLKGKELATTFSFLRPNDLVWNYVVGNYLKGDKPPPFDLLYWNGDSTNLPGPMFCWYLRHTYLQDELRQPGKLTVCGEKIDLGKIKAPVFIYGSREDHIVPWDAAFGSTKILKGKLRFVLGASGHIAGVVNPPAAKKRSHWVDGKLGGNAKQWFESAKEMPGSWWTDWASWLKPHAGKLIPAPKAYGDRSHKAIEAAPGRYVKAKA